MKVNELLPKRLIVRELDNRDQNATWVWVVAVGRPQFVEIDPIELFLNMLENHDVDTADKILERVVAQVSVRDYSVARNGGDV